MLATLSLRLAALRPIVYSGLAEKSSLSIGISGLDAKFQYNHDVYSRATGTGGGTLWTAWKGVS